MENNMKALNKLLQGEHMAIEGYEIVMSTIKDEETSEKLNGILEDHKRHAMEINDRIYKLGGKPQESTGMVGLMSDLKLKVEGMVSGNEVMLKELHKGEKMGIEAVKGIINEDLDQESIIMVEEMIRTDERHLGQLDQLIKQQHQ